MFIIRNAVVSDIDAIMNVEEQSFGEGISPEAMATREQMILRITFFEKLGFTEGFLLAEYEGEIVGYIISFPTALSPEQCTSWEVATDAGNLQATFDIGGQNMFIVSLASLSGAPACTTDALAHSVFVTLLDRLRMYGYREGYCMFCARMPGYSRAYTKTGIPPEQYCMLEDSQGYPKDPLLQIFHAMTGAKPYKFLRNGYPPDQYSGGHGVLFAVDNAAQALRNMAHLLCQK